MTLLNTFKKGNSKTVAVSISIQLSWEVWQKKISSLKSGRKSHKKNVPLIIKIKEKIINSKRVVWQLENREISIL